MCVCIYIYIYDKAVYQLLSVTIITSIITIIVAIIYDCYYHY